MKRIFKYYFIILLLLYCNVLYAAGEFIPPDIGAAITNVSNPGLVQQRIQATTPQLPSRAAALHPPAEQAPKMSAAEAKIKFVLNKVNFKDNTKFSDAELEKIFLPYYHKQISLADLQNLVNAVTVKYRTAGYILSRAILPPQTINKGIVEVQVIEGFISKVDIKTPSTWVYKVVWGYIKNILNTRPLQISMLERDLLLMNDIPGLAVKAVITPSKTVPAAADLTLVTDQNYVTGYLSYDNYGTRYLGPKEFGGGITVNGVTTPGSSDGIQYLTTPTTSELQYYGYNHMNPIGTQGGKFNFGFNYTYTNSGFVLQPLTVLGFNNAFYGDLSYPMIRSRSENLYVHTMGNFQNTSSTILGFPFYFDRLRTLVLGADYSTVDRFKGVDEVKLDVEKGFDIMGARQHFNQSRPNGLPDFIKGTFYASRNQSLPWQLSLFGAMIYQYTPQTLLVSEQFSYGGPIWGRGYMPSEIVGDSAIAAKIELRRDTYYEKAWLNAIQYYAFYDAGNIWNKDKVNLPPQQSATSMGVGGRVTFMPRLTGNLYYAKPLTHSASTQLILGRDPKAPAWFFQVIASF